MTFEFHLLLPTSVAVQRITKVVEMFGGDRPIKNWSVTKAQFLEKLQTGIYALLWDEPEQTSSVARDYRHVGSLQTPLYADAESSNLDLQLVLSLAPMTSPILFSDVNALGNEYQLKSEKMRMTANLPARKHGIISLPPSQRQFLERGLFYVKLEGNVPPQPSDFSSVKPNWSELESLETFVKSVISGLEPVYGFATEDKDLDYVPNYSEFPPLNCWDFCWRVFLFGRHFVEKKGSDFLLATPAHKVDRLDTHLIWIQPTDEVYAHDTVFNTSQILSGSERKNYRKLVKKYLQLSEPFGSDEGEVLG